MTPRHGRGKALATPAAVVLTIALGVGGYNTITTGVPWRKGRAVLTPKAEPPAPGTTRRAVNGVQGPENTQRGR